jgi:hypothetical protein
MDLDLGGDGQVMGIKQVNYSFFFRFLLNLRDGMLICSIRFWLSCYD